MPSDAESATRKSGARKRAHIANVERRQVVARDGLRCSYVGDDGARCNARAFLQLHHDHAWAKGGSDTVMARSSRSSFG